MLVKIHSETPNQRHIKFAIEALKNGELIAYPTDTLYGLGCDMYNKSAIEAIYNFKQINRKKPLSIICHDFSQVSEFAMISNSAFKTMKSLLPGAFTFILPSTSNVPKILMTRQKTIGVRIPVNIFIKEIVKELGNPIISTTITSDSEIIMSDPFEIEKKYSHIISIIFHDDTSFKDPSTIIDLTEDEIEILREGSGDINEF